VLRRKACDGFGTQPARRYEDEIVKVFREHPNLVAGDIDVVIDDYHHGNVRSPWAILAYRVKQDAERADAAHLIHAVAGDEPKQIRDTRKLIRNRIYVEEAIDVAHDEIAAALGPFATPDNIADGLNEWRERRLQVGWG
jgi:hypothetical protein